MTGGLSDLCIKRPVMTVLLMVSILLAGLISYKILPVSDLPNVDFPTIVVTATLPGASPETMASTVATVLEKQFATIAGIDSMSSVSTTGSVQITIQFSLERDIDAAAQDVQAAIGNAQRRLPDDMPSPPSYRKSNPSNMAIFILGLTSPSLSPQVMDRYAQTLSERISMLNGVAQAQLRGSKKFAIRVQLDPEAMQLYGLGSEEVAQAISDQNVNLPMGDLSGSHSRITLKADGQLEAASQYEKIIVAVRDGQPVRLSQVATVLDSVENLEDDAWIYQGEERAKAIFLFIQKQPGSNTLEVARNIKNLLPVFQEALPGSLHLSVIRDGSQSIQESVDDVQFTLLLTLALVVLVIFLFIRNVSSTIIPALSLPMSIFGTFAAMQVFGFSINNISLMALTLSVGFVVDDAIVMLENIVRHAEMGKPRLQAAIDGAREVGFTIISMTVSLAAIFIPLLFMGGIVGRLFREFSVTIGVAVLISCFISLTLTPMLGSRYLKEHGTEQHGRLYLMTERLYDLALAAYRVSLLVVLDHKRMTLALSALVLALTIWLFMIVPKGFLPSEDRGYINVSTETAADISFPALVERMERLAEIVRKDENVESFVMDVDTDGSMRINLKPRQERPLSADQLIEKLRPPMNSIPGIRAMLVNQPPINLTGRRVRSLYQLTLQGTDAKELYGEAQRLEREMKSIDALTDVSSDLQLKNGELRLRIKRDQSLLYGISPRMIEQSLYDYFGERSISTIYATNDQYDVIISAAPDGQLDSRALAAIRLPSATGEMTPLAAVADWEMGLGPLSINHSGQLQSVTISFNLRPGVSLSDAIAVIDPLRASLPVTVPSLFQGSAQQFQSSQASMTWLLAIAIIVIYIVLGILYESYIHPLTILTALPFAGFGALLTLLLFRVELSIYAFVGIIMLIGLVKKNGIMMIDFAVSAREKEGKNAHDAIVEACCIRFRPIMMTTFAALMGAVPIAVGYGAGGESRQPLGLAVVGGLLFSQTLTLYVTPVFYIYMEGFRERWARRECA
ncbi:MAG: efflux RND transporter permease subunit [Desulfobulbaceae bacterium]|jgi:HAE1 family hydrophobic/amphiphilic exporter-1|nr:efflux RND transporter permease subunit [Desulfobulbaceae bacterium]